MIPSVFLQIWNVEPVQSESSTWMHKLSGNLKFKINEIEVQKAPDDDHNLTYWSEGSYTHQSD